MISDQGESASVRDAGGALTAEDAEKLIAAWLKSYLSDLLRIPTDQIDEEMAFQRYGLDSSSAVGMAGDLGAWLGCEVDSAAPYDFPSIRALSQELARQDDARATLARMR